MKNPVTLEEIIERVSNQFPSLDWKITKWFESSVVQCQINKHSVIRLSPLNRAIGYRGDNDFHNVCVDWHGHNEGFGGGSMDWIEVYGDIREALKRSGVKIDEQISLFGEDQ